MTQTLFSDMKIFLQGKSQRVETDSRSGTISMKRRNKQDDGIVFQQSTRENIRIEILYPLDGHQLCYQHELELMADLFSDERQISLDADLSAVILIDGSQISHLFSGSLDCRLPSYVQNRSSLLEVAVVAGDGTTLGKETVCSRCCNRPVCSLQHHKRECEVLPHQTSSPE